MIRRAAWDFNLLKALSLLWMKESVDGVEEHCGLVDERHVAAVGQHGQSRALDVLLHVLRYRRIDLIVISDRDQGWHLERFQTVRKLHVLQIAIDHELA